jgi:hypothetical protein
VNLKLAKSPILIIRIVSTFRLDLGVITRSYTVSMSFFQRIPVLFYPRVFGLCYGKETHHLLVVSKIVYFPFHTWVVILPIDFHIFQDG